MREDDIAQCLRDGGVAEPDDVLKDLRLEIKYPARQLVDERWVWLPTLLALRGFTHRVAADEVAHDLLTVSPDLAPITTLCDHPDYQQLADGTPVRTVLEEYDDELLEERGIPTEVVDPHGALLLAPGTLASLGVGDGDLVGVRLTERGLALERVTAVADADVAAGLAATLDPDKPEFFPAAVWTVCAQDPTAFTEPLPPLSEIVDDCGLTRRGEWLAPVGFDWARWDFDRGCRALTTRHDIDPDDAVTLYALIQLYEQVAQLVESASADASVDVDVDVDAEPEAGPTPAAEDEGRPEADGFADLAAELGAALADPLLAELLVEETIGDDPSGAAALGLFADALEPRVPRAARVAFRWLRAVALEQMGDVEEAEREFLAAESMDPDWPLPLLDLARFASDRGDAARALALLRRAEAEPDHPLLELLEHNQVEARHDLGRNEQCWCGSGRKYKKCHLGKERLPLDDRAAWLYAKAAQHALLSGWDDVLFEAGYERCRHAVDDPDALDAALSDPLVLDAVLFEGGALAEFLEIRGSLLPDDERLLAERWLAVQRSVFEVERVQPGQGVTVRDVRTGERHEVRERAASRQLQPGWVVCAHVLPAADTEQFFGGLERVAPHERDALTELLDAEPDPVTLVAQLSQRFSPPESPPGAAD